MDLRNRNLLRTCTASSLEDFPQQSGSGRHASADNTRQRKTRRNATRDPLFSIRRFSSRTRLPISSIHRHELLENPFYRRYICDASTLPTLTGHNLTSPGANKFQADLSDWNDEHVLACRVVPLTGLPIQRVIPEEYFEDVSELEQRLILDFERFSVEELEYGCAEDIPRRNLMSKPLQSLRRILATDSMVDVGHACCLVERILSPLLQNSVLNLENKRFKFRLDTQPRVENSVTLGGETNWKLSTLSSLVFKDVTESEMHFLDLDKEDRIPVVGFYFQHRKAFVPGPREGDGSGWSLYDDSDVSSICSDVGSDVGSIFSASPPPPRPTESIHLRGVNIPSPSSYAQELGMMIVHIMANSTFYGVGDCEAFVIGMNHTRMHISAAFFPSEHIVEAMKNPVLPTDSLVYFLQSEEFDLALPEGRRDGLRALIALFKYMLSGKVKIGRMKKFAKELKARRAELKR
ncbi:hypothetical protein BT69DRAFT_1354648 [Atractiella rhizophila]|nr:hypothetical protein BT69DRAFT_1354648 [Atractiella rhizophila]